MPFLRRKREHEPDDPKDQPEDDAADTSDDATDDDVDDSDDAVPAEADVDEDAADDEDADDEDADDTDDDDEDDSRSPKSDDTKPRLRRDGLRAWLRARPKAPDHGPDYAVRVATLPDLEQFPEDGHVHPEIVRSWMALQQFGEAMLLVSWFQERPAGYVMVSWTGDWDDAIRKKYKDVPSITNLWVDDEHADQDVERKLLEAAITVVEKQGKRRALISVDREDKPARRLYRDLGFTDTKYRTTDSYVYRDATGKKRRGVHKNLVLVLELDADEDLDDETDATDEVEDTDHADESDEDAKSDESDESDESDDEESQVDQSDSERG